MSAPRWERITSGGQVVYWRRPVAEHVYMTITREPAGYRWALRGPRYDRTGGFAIREEGRAPTWAKARKAAEAVAPDRCPHDGTLLDDQFDAWICPRCGDEWGLELVYGEAS